MGEGVLAHWRGMGAARLGLIGPVKDQDFLALLNNRTPYGDKLTVRDRPNRVPMTDFTFNAPKSVSLLWAVSGDKRFVDAHNRAVEAAMAEVERGMQTRVRKGKHAQKETVRDTGNAIWAGFQQADARPVDGVVDPHLHTHCALINATWDDVEGRFKAAEIRNIVADKHYYQAVYHTMLMAELKKLGFAPERYGRFWDIAGIPRSLIERFSRRTMEIEEEAAKAEHLSDAQKGALGLRTRAQKYGSTDDAQIQATALARLDTKDRAVLDGVLRTASTKGPIRRTETVVGALRHGLDLALERASVVFEKRVLGDALWQGMGDVNVSELRTAASLAELLRGTVDGRAVISTKEMQQIEEHMVTIAREGRAACLPLGSGTYGVSQKRVNARQREAIHHIWSSSDRFMLIEGDAGVGKTTGVLREAVAGLQSAGHKVFCFAPTTGAVDVLANEIDAPAYTLKRLLIDTKLQQGLRGGVLLIDEAGLVGVKAMADLFEIAEREHCRIVLCGDTKQHQSVEAGDAMRLLHERCGLHTPRVNEIVRQKGAYRDAVSALAEGKLEEGWKRFENMGAVIEVDDAERAEQVAKDYVSEVSDGHSVLVVAPTHREKDAVTKHIRNHLNWTGRLGAEERSVYRLVDTRWSQAERKEPDRYQAGMIVKCLGQITPGLQSGDRIEVIGKDAQGAPLFDTRDGRQQQLPLDRAEQFKVYRQSTLALRPGDLVRTVEQGRDVEGHMLPTGTTLRLKSIGQDGSMRFDEKLRLPANFGHLDYGYCSTSYGAQGRTVDTVLGCMDSKQDVAVSQEQFYVTASRGRLAFRLYTDDAEALASAVKRSSARASAMELTDGTVDIKLAPDPKRTDLVETCIRQSRRAEPKSLPLSEHSPNKEPAYEHERGIDL